MKTEDLELLQLAREVLEDLASSLQEVVAVAEAACPVLVLVVAAQDLGEKLLQVAGMVAKGIVSLQEGAPFEAEDLELLQVGSEVAVDLVSLKAL